MATHCSGLLQEDLENHASTGYDIIFKSWAVADKLSLHSIAADCEWALAKLWKTEKVYTRAVLDLSPGALQRIARSLCAGAEAARKEFESMQEHRIRRYITDDELENVSKCLDASASAQTMKKWRMNSLKR